MFTEAEEASYDQGSKNCIICFVVQRHFCPVALTTSASTPNTVSLHRNEETMAVCVCALFLIERCWGFTEKCDWRGVTSERRCELSPTVFIWGCGRGRSSMAEWTQPSTAQRQRSHTSLYCLLAFCCLAI